MKKATLLLFAFLLASTAVYAAESETILLSYGNSEGNPSLRTKGLYGPITLVNAGGVLYWKKKGAAEGWFEPKARMLVIDPHSSFSKTALSGTKRVYGAGGWGHDVKSFKEAGSFPLFYILDPGDTVLTRGLNYLLDNSDKLAAYQAALTAGKEEDACRLNKEIASASVFQVFSNELRRRDREGCRATWLSLAAFFNKPKGEHSALEKKISNDEATEWQSKADHTITAVAVKTTESPEVDSESAMFTSPASPSTIKDKPKVGKESKSAPKAAPKVELADIEKIFHLPLNRASNDSVGFIGGEVTRDGNHTAGEYFLAGGYNSAPEVITERLQEFHKRGPDIFNDDQDQK